MKLTVRLPICLVLALVLGVLGLASAQIPQHVATYAHPGTFPDLDPRSGFSNENVVMSNVYETLTRYQLDGTVAPLLASSWEASEDGLNWTFTLAIGPCFHDGSPVDAAAVKASLERTKELNLGAAFILDPIETITVVDYRTVNFELSYAAPLDLILSSGYGAWIMSLDSIDQDNAWFNDGNDGGSGPYTIRSYAPGQNLVLDAYGEYWQGWEDDQFVTVVFEIIEEPTLREQMIRSGEADFTYQLPFDSYLPLSSAPDVVVDTTPSFQSLYGLLNTRKAPLDDPRVRRALQHSFPYGVVVDNLWGGLGNRATGAVPTGIWGSVAEPAVGYDLNEAKRLLTEAGVSDLELVYTYNAGDLEEQLVGELWRSELSKLGIDLEVLGLAWEAQWDLAQSDPENAQDIFVMYWWPTYITPYDFLFSMFHSEDTPFFNLGYYANEAFDALIDEAASLSGTDRERAVALFEESQQVLDADAAAVYMIEVPDTHVVRSDIVGYQNNPAYPHVVFWYELSR